MLKQSPRLLWLLALKLFVVTVVGCGGSDRETEGDSTPEVSEVVQLLKPDPPFEAKPSEIEILLEPDLNLVKQVDRKVNSLRTVILQNLSDDQTGTWDGIADDFSGTGILRDELKYVVQNQPFNIYRWRNTSSESSHQGVAGFKDLLVSSYQPFMNATETDIHLQTQEIQRNRDEVSAKLVAELFGVQGSRTFQFTTLVDVAWRMKNDEVAELLRWKSVAHEECLLDVGQEKLFQDHAASILERSPSAASLLGKSMDSLAREVPASSIAGQHGIAIGDLNGDGLDDFYLCQPHGFPNLLFFKNPDGTVDERGEAAGLAILDDTTAALCADFDNDGDQDLALATDEAVLLFSQQKSGKFLLEKELMTGRAARCLSAVDYDQDGNLDLFVGKYAQFRNTHDLIPNVSGVRDKIRGGRNLMFRNEEAWAFRNVTFEVGFNVDNSRTTTSSSWFDFDDDGDQDLVLTHDFSDISLFKNQDGWFKNIDLPTDVGRYSDATVSDFNEDGKLDFVVASETSPFVRNALGLFETGNVEVREALQTNDAFFYSTAGEKQPLGIYTFPKLLFSTNSSVACQNVDINLDGYSDLLFGNGKMTRRPANAAADWIPSLFAAFPFETQATDGSEDAKAASGKQVAIVDPRVASTRLCRSIYEGQSFEGNQSNRCFLNLGGMRIANISKVAGFDQMEDARAIATTDWDQDGDLDLILVARTAPRLRILLNQLESKNRFLHIDLVGTTSNRDAVGAQVRVHLSNRSVPLIQTISASTTGAGQSSRKAMFGLGEAGLIAKVEVRWPNGKSQVYRGIQPNSYYRITEDSDEAEELSNLAMTTKNLNPGALSNTASKLPERSLFYPPAVLPRLHYRDQDDVVKILSARSPKPLLAIFVPSDSAMATLKFIREQASELKSEEFDSVVIGMGANGSEVSPDQFKTTIEGGPDSTSWGVASASMQQKIESLYGGWFGRSQFRGGPDIWLLDSENQVRVVYDSSSATMSKIQQDLKRLSSSELEWREYVGVSTGKWISRYRRPRYRHLSSLLSLMGYDVDATLLQKRSAGYLAVEFTQIAREFLDLNDIPSAKKFLEMSFESDDTYVPAFLVLAEYNLQTAIKNKRHPLHSSMLDEAKLIYERVLELDPSSSRATLGLSQVYNEQGEPESAINRLLAFLEAEPEHFDVHAAVGRLYYFENDYVKATRHLVQAFENQPTLPNVAGELGYIYLRNGDPQGAVKFLRLATRLQPSEAHFWRHRAEAEFRVKEFAQAVEILQRVVKNQPTRIRSKSLLSWVLATSPFASLRDGDKAIELIEKTALEVQNRSCVMLETLAAAYAEVGRFDEAITIQKKAMEIQKNRLSEIRYSPAQKQGMATRLELYQRQKPYRTEKIDEVPIAPAPLR